MPSTVPIHFYIKNIPASDADPFQIKFQDKIIFESKTDVTSLVEHVVQIEEPTHASYHRIYLNILIPMIDIDELNQYNLTEMGTHFEISTVNLKLQVKQGFNSDFSSMTDRVLIDDQKKFDVDEKTGEVYYKHKKPAYLQEGYEKPKSKEKIALEEENKKNFEVASTRVWFHLSGIEASDQEPFALSVNGQNVFKWSKRIGKRQQFPVYIKKSDPNAKHHIIDLQIDIPMLGIEGATSTFNLNTNGQQIMIAVIDDGTNVKILQADSRDKLPNYDDHYKKWDDVVVAYEKKNPTVPTSSSPTTTTTTSASTSNSSSSAAKSGTAVPVFFYASNIPASAQEPFKISVNGQLLYESKRNISKQEIVSAECELPPPSNKGADHIILVRYQIGSRGADFEQEFNLTRNGAYIMIKLSDESGEERVSLQQQHKNVYGGGDPAPAAIARPRKDSSPPEIDTVHFYLNNIPASTTQPFELLVNGQAFYHTTDDMSIGEKKNQIASFEGRLPRPKSGDHIVQFIAKVPMITREQVSVEFNLTKNGKYVKVFVDGQKKVHLLQSLNDKFEEPVGTEPAADGYIKELEMLASLYEGGILTKDEFEQKKRKVLGL